MIVLIAQGGGFYGCALMTLEMGVGEAQERLAKLGWEATVDPDGSFTIEPEENPFSDGQTIVTVREWRGQPQPDPVVVLDTGHACEDLVALIHIQKTLAGQVKRVS